MDFDFSHDQVDAIQRDPNTPTDIKATVTQLYNLKTWSDSNEVVEGADGTFAVQVKPEAEAPKDPGPLPGQDPAPQEVPPAIADPATAPVDPAAAPGETPSEEAAEAAAEREAAGPLPGSDSPTGAAAPSSPGTAADGSTFPGHS